MTSNETNPSIVPEESLPITLREPQLRDLQALHNFLPAWIKSHDDGTVLTDEIGEVLTAVARSVNKQDTSRQFLIAQDESGEAVGMLGMKEPGADMLPYATTDKPIEMINAYVDPAYASNGIGGQLLEAMEQQAAQQGYLEVLVNSGPRYRDSGWAFWTAKYGEPVAVAEGMYGEGGDAPVWRKPLSPIS